MSRFEPRVSRLLNHVVELGVARGYHRAHKHVDSPTEQQLIDVITEYVINELHEWFNIDDEDYRVANPTDM